MNYQSIAGHQQEKELFLNWVERSNTPHAVMVLGNNGYGLLRMVLALANHLLCKTPNEYGACGACNACQKSFKFIHPDLHFAFPVVKKDGKKREETTSKDFLPEWRTMLHAGDDFGMPEWLNQIGAQDKLANINTAECNEISHKLGLKAFESINKILIVWMPEFLGKEGNRLLKIIEEPPENTYVFLVAEQQENILNTILSRCQIVKVHPYSDDDVKQALVMRGATSSAINEMVSMAYGDMIKATSLLKNGKLDLSQGVLRWLRASYMMDKKPADCINFVEEFYRKSKSEQKLFIEYVLHFFSAYHLALISGQTSSRVSKEEQEAIQKLKNIITFDKIKAIVYELDELLILQKRNANMKIALMASSIKLSRVMKSKLGLSTLVK